MSSVSRQVGGSVEASGPKVLFELDAIDLAAKFRTSEQIAEQNPHRGQMALLDAIVWHAADATRGIAVKHVRDDEFWVDGHFPGMPLLPGVLQIEAGAQLACYLFNIRQSVPTHAVFLRIQDAAFRSRVEPGDDLFILCQDIKLTSRRFICAIQGLVLKPGQPVSQGAIAFDAQITGMKVPGPDNGSENGSDNGSENGA